MGILGIGVDVLHIPRLLAVIERRTAKRLASRILSQVEMSTWESLPSCDDARRTRFLAVRWSLKEAAYKAVYPIVQPTWKDLTFLSTPDSRKPVLEYHPGSTCPTVGKLHASISHDGEYIFTTVLAESTGTSGS
ncbi:Holo-[acyl-carrier-protein] synthase [Grifola frondosa]|uniref:Holo-[acyl-carrier-protein] synthase n=1 Tax=Grifola frondosa TaxID=5627 RepID=A0A1C7MIR9_GRIFR|nr:Holo-[acyl-carrier-protein] synthase [Grifola frondosa]